MVRKEAQYLSLQSWSSRSFKSESNQNYEHAQRTKLLFSIVIIDVYPPLLFFFILFQETWTSCL